MTLQYQLWKLGLILHLLLVYDFGQLTSSLALCHGLIPLLGYTPRQKSRKDKRVLSRSSCRLLAGWYALPLSYAQPSSRSIMSMRRSTWYQVLYENSWNCTKISDGYFAVRDPSPFHIDKMACQFIKGRNVPVDYALVRTILVTVCTALYRKSYWDAVWDVTSCTCCCSMNLDDLIKVYISVLNDSGITDH